MDLTDYLSGRMPRCPGYNMPAAHGCGRRVPRMDAMLCNGCSVMKNHDDFKDAFAQPNTDGKWYISWTNFDSHNPAGYHCFVCRSCGDRRGAQEFGVLDNYGNLVPAAACCTQTMTCHAAEEFWGKDGNEPYFAMLTHMKDPLAEKRATLKVKEQAAAALKPAAMAAAFALKHADKGSDAVSNELHTHWSAQEHLPAGTRGG